MLPASQVARRDDLGDFLTVLCEDFIVKSFFRKILGKGDADDAAEHEGGNERKIMRHFKNEQHAGDRSPHNCAEAGTHADDRERRNFFGPDSRNEKGEKPCECRAAGASEEERGRKNTAATAEPVTERRCRQFGCQQKSGNPPTEIRVECRTQIFVPEKEDAEVTGRKEDCAPERPHKNSSCDNPDRGGDAGKPGLPEAANFQRGLLKKEPGQRRNAGRQRREKIDRSARVLRCRNRKNRRVSHEEVGDECSRDGGKQDGPDESAV